MSARYKAYLELLVVSIIWGAAGPVIKFTLHDFPPLVFLTYRFAISSIIAFTYFSFTKEKVSINPKTILPMLLYSLLAVTFGLGLLFFGFDKTSSLSGSLISAMAPLALVIASAEFLKERVTHAERLGIGLAFVGTIITVVGPLFMKDGALAFGAFEGNMLIALSLVVDTIAAILVKVIMRQKVSPVLLTHVSFMIGFATIAPIAIASSSLAGIAGYIIHAPLAAHLGVWYMAILSGSLAYTLRNRAVKSIEVSETAVFSYLYPLWAAPLAVWWLGEKITPPFVIGAAVIATGVVIAEHKRRAKHALSHKRRYATMQLLWHKQRNGSRRSIRR